MHKLTSRALAVGIALALASAGNAQAQVVISQVYGGAGTATTGYNADFIELHNNGDAAVSLNGWSVQYAQNSGNWLRTPLSGSIAAGGYYLIRQASGAGNLSLPPVNASGGIAMTPGLGKVALVANNITLSAACPTGLIDFVGYGAANCAEGAAPVSASNVSAQLRKNGGCTDTQVNAADFIVATAKPRGGTAPRLVCSSWAPPVLTASVGEIVEGDSGYADALITLRLDRPAGAGGIAWSALILPGGSAVPGEDYNAIDPSGVIPAGQSSARFVLPVLGDLHYEADETVNLRIKVASGAVAANGDYLDTQATLINDDLRVTPIHEVQGRGAVSPLRDQWVIVEGIVTAVVKDGFFLQADAGQADADADTSEGVFVQTASAPSPQWRAQRVRASGTVMELMSPGDHPQRESMTAIGGSPSVTQLSTMPVMLPPPVSPLLPDYHIGARGYEQYEGMRVMLPQTRVVGPTRAITDIGTGHSVSDGRFYVVDGGQNPAAPFVAPEREPGTRYPVYWQGQFQGWLPRWDGNPEVLGVDSAAAGHAPIDLSTGAPIGGLIGPLDHRSGRYSIVLDADAPTWLPPPSPPTPSVVAAGAPDQRATTLAHYDLRDLFDFSSPPGSGQPAPMPFALERRLGKISRGIRENLRMPDIVAISGVENELLLQRLANRIDSDAMSDGQPAAQYRAIAPPGNDPNATNLGFLVRSDAIVNVGARVILDKIEQLGSDAFAQAPGGGMIALFDQPPLVIDTRSNYADGSAWRARIVLVRLQSLDGIDADSVRAERLRERRRDQAQFLAQWAQQQQHAADALPLLFLGDFQAHAFNDGLVDPVGMMIGQPSDPLLTMVAHDGADQVEPDLIDLTATQAQAQRYSSIDQGSRQELQHVLADENLLMQTESIALERVRINADFPAQWRDDEASAIRGGDTDPVHVRLVPREKASLRVWAQRSAPSHRVGESMQPTFTAQVQNLGPQVARQVGLGLALSEPVEPLWVNVHSSNWTCEPPVTADGRTSVACTGLNVSPQGPSSNAVSLSFSATPERAGRSITLAASVVSSALDADPSDNAAQTSIEILPAPAPQP